MRGFATEALAAREVDELEAFMLNVVTKRLAGAQPDAGKVND